MLFLQAIKRYRIIYMNWNTLSQPNQLAQLDEESKNERVVIFKHSTRCNISSAALNRIERKWKEEDDALVKPYYLDLLSYRQLSYEIAEKYGVEHQSPQVLIIENGKCIFSTTHFDITYDSLFQKEFTY